MRGGIIEKFKNKFQNKSVEKTKDSEDIKINIKNEIFKDFNLDILNYEKEYNFFSIQTNNLKLETIIREIDKKSNVEIKKCPIFFEEITVKEKKMTESIIIKELILDSNKKILDSKIREVNVETLTVKVNDIKNTTGDVSIKGGMDLICTVPKIYYSAIDISKEKLREIGRKIKKKNTEISFSEYGIKHIFLNIPYRTIERIDYNEQRGSLKIFYKKEFKESEMINYVVLKNINTKMIKKIFI